MNSREYKNIITSIRAKYPKLCIYGMWKPIVNGLTQHIEIETSMYADIFNKISEALDEILYKYQEPEKLCYIIKYMRKRFPKSIIFPGVVIAACIYKGCKISKEIESDDWVYYDCLIFPPHLNNQ